MGCVFNFGRGNLLMDIDAAYHFGANDVSSVRVADIGDEVQLPAEMLH